MSATHPGYYIPHDTRWPIMGSIGLFALLGGFAMLLNGSSSAPVVMIIGTLILVVMIIGWFGTVIKESESGFYNDQVDISFRHGMIWFIFSEVLFFAAFFGALFYARIYSVPWLGGEGSVGATTGPLLWPGFEGIWPTNGPAEIGGAFGTIPAVGIPLLNTIILITSGATVTLAHWALKKNQRKPLCWWLLATVLLGLVFLYFQGVEFAHAYNDLNLTLESGIYGSTFFMLTGFHGLHVTIGAIMLLVMLLRAMRGHFTPERHFAFEAAAWYWHFVDVVWIGLFIFVYWF
ncbi:cytochrome c oxidase subunit 3 [Thioalkalivibrio sp. HK1]|uniref:cytochrome c oxidase subunit 3 n=1 Tax=Thioalkalivibrio sp. HK1 TaxID=1469245 RepID=UPI0004707957|nr:cytochrome c oxidase subunit 3 [Thioalkalivibrio sp. HK1]